MPFENLKLNSTAVTICVVVNILAAFLWYRPFLFGRLWGGITGQPMDGPPDPKKLMTGIVCAVILVFTLALLIKGLSVTTAGGALLFGVLAGIGIVGAVGLPVSLYNAQGVKLFFIDYGLSLFTIVMDSFILVLMK